VDIREAAWFGANPVCAEMMPLVPTGELPETRTPPRFRSPNLGGVLDGQVIARERYNLGVAEIASRIPRDPRWIRNRRFVRALARGWQSS